MLDTWVVDVTRRALTDELDSFIEPVWDELQSAVDALFGTDTMQCQDKGYLKASISAIDTIVSSAGLVGFLPPFLRPLFGLVAGWRTRTVISDLETRCKDMLEWRFSLVATRPDDTSQDPNDLMQRIIRLAPEHRPAEMNVGDMTRRLLTTHLGFIYQAGFAATNVMRNILSSDHEYDMIRLLRAEAQHFLKASHRECDSSQQEHKQHFWTHSNAARMIFADSVGRETLCLHTVPTRALIRQVLVDGLVGDTGLPLPKGSLVFVVSQPMHTDVATFPDEPCAFRPFRFVDRRDTCFHTKGYGHQNANAARARE